MELLRVGGQLERSKLKDQLLSDPETTIPPTIWVVEEKLNLSARYLILVLPFFQ